MTSAKRRPGRPLGNDSEHTRARIVAEAAGLITEKGFAAMTMTDVAAAAGISPTGLKHHFRSKASLLAAVLQRRDDEDSIAEFSDIADGTWRSIDAAVRMARLNMAREAVVRLYVSVTGEAVNAAHPAHGWMRAHYTGFVENLIASFRALQDAGRLRSDAPVEVLAREIVALMDGLQVQWLLDPDVDMGRIAEQRIEEIKERWGRRRGDGP